MTQFSLLKTIKNNNEKNIIYFVFTKFYLFVYSYPLYFSYFIFFSPYLFKFIHFFYPLFFTTFLLFLSLATIFTPLNSILNTKDGFFSTLKNFTLIFDVEKDEKLINMEEFEFCKFLFDVPTIELNEANPFEEIKFGENPFNNFCQVEEKTEDINPKNIEVKSEHKKLTAIKKRRTQVENPPKFQSLMVNNGNLGEFESTRQGKEWRGTLACFLFEERHNWSNKKVNLDGSFDSEEGMDLLWETNEIDENMVILKVEKENKKKLRRKSNKIDEDLIKKDCNDDHDNDDDDQSENVDDDGKICCLQALKLSIAKMNLSMGRPNLVKVSRVFKGIGWLHSQVRKHGKQGYK